MRDPFFLVDPSRTEIISHARVEVTRRDFVQSMAVAGVAVGVGSASWAAETKTGDMIYRILGRTGQKISAIVLELKTDDPQPDRLQIRIWIGDDARRLPLRLTAVTDLGPVRADLVILPAAAK